MELVEHLAKIALVARQLGGPVPLESSVVDALCKKGRPSSAAPGREDVQKNLSSSNPVSSVDPNEIVAQALRKLR